MNGVSERDAAFLAEMGIGPLWQLRAAPPAAEAVPQAAEAGPAAAARAAPADDQSWGDMKAYAVQGAPMPPAEAPATPEGITDEEIAGMDWDQLNAALARCRRCGACRDGHPPVSGSGARQARWLVAAGATSAADERAGAPLAGDPGKLFDNMLFAVDLSRERDVYVTNLIKCRPTSASGGDRAPTADEAAACRPFLERELALTGAATVLTLGQIAANGLLGKPLQEPLAGARGSVHALGAAALVATLHPGELLRRGADKALAWADLCRARAADGRGD
jgi:uracil-DNA glycosylase